MSPAEFTDALSYAMGLFDVQIVGFQDATGLIVTPSQICKYPEILRPDYHEVMLRKCASSQHRRSNHKTQLSQSKFDRTDEFDRTHSTRYSPPSPRTPEINFYPQPRRNPEFNESRRGQEYKLSESRSRQRKDYQDIDINSLSYNLVAHMPVDNVLTESMKQRIIKLVHSKDKGVIGALMLYSEDYDFEGFKARILHKITAGAREAAASQKSFGSQFQYPSTALGGQRKRNPQTPQDRFIQMVLDIEHKGFIDEQSACIIKTLLLEENATVFKKFNEYFQQQLSSQELGYKVTRLAHHMSAYCERPTSPMPKRKQELMTYVNSLARYHFSDPDDIQLLQKLVHDENEFILSTFDVFDSDQDHENLIDSLQRILDKSKSMGVHLKSVQATSFYHESDHWGQQRHYQFEQPQPQLVQHQRVARPKSPLNGERQVQDIYYHQANLARNQFEERPRNQQRQRIIVTRGEMRSDGEFRPTTTVHDVALIPNYFSSGEEDIEQQRLASREGYSHNIYKTPSQSNFQAHLQGNLNANYFYRTPHQMRPDMEEFQYQEPQPRDQILIRDGDQEQLNDQQERPQRKAHQNRSTSQPMARSNYDRQQKQTVEAPKFIVSQEASLRHAQSKHSARSQQEEPKKQKKRKHKKYSSSEPSNSSQTSSSSSESESSRERRRKQRKLKKKNKQISVKAIKKIISEQKIAAAMRSDLFIYLSQLLTIEPIDQDLAKVFQTYNKNRDSSELLTQLMTTCEDKLLAFFIQAFSNQEVNEIEKLRKSRNGQYIQSFADFSKSGDQNELIQNLKQTVKQQLQPPQPALRSKEALREVLGLALQSRLFSDSDCTMLREALESADGEALSNVLAAYTNHKDYLLLTQEVKQVQETLPSSHVFSTIQQAIYDFAREEQISHSEAKESLQLLTNNDRNLNAIWTVYELMNDKNDFLESIKVLLSVNAKKETQQAEQKQSESSSFDRSIKSPPHLTNQTQPSQQPSQGSMIRMVPMESVADQSYSESDQGESPISQSPASSTGRLNILSESQVCDILQHQHSILRKYAMTGMISYTDAPAFHDLVEKRDYRIVCVFEVFSQNRSEDDFLENLALIAQFVREQEVVEQQRPEILVWEPQDSFLLEVDSLASNNLIQNEQQQWLLAKRKEEDKMIEKVWKAFKQTKDREDLVDSLLRLFKKMNVAPAPVPVVQQQPGISLMQTDPFAGEVESLLAQGKFTQVEAKFCLDLIKQKDRKLTSIYSAFLRTKDREDFLHTVKRYFAQKQPK